MAETNSEFFMFQQGQLEQTTDKLQGAFESSEFIKQDLKLMYPHVFASKDGGDEDDDGVKKAPNAAAAAG